jgi:hypothetical protein
MNFSRGDSITSGEGLTLDAKKDLTSMHASKIITPMKESTSKVVNLSSAASGGGSGGKGLRSKAATSFVDRATTNDRVSDSGLFTTSFKENSGDNNAFNPFAPGATKVKMNHSSSALAHKQECTQQ